MICPPCQRAGDYNADHIADDGLIRQIHDECLGKSRCDCQHKVGPSEKFHQT